VTTLATVLQQFTTRYRTALLLKAGVLAALGLAVAGLLALRLRALQGPSPWSVAIPGLLVGAMGGGLGWWLRRHWLSGGRAAAHLDRELGLQQRLLTAEQFATAAQPPTLYPLLVEDAARQCSRANPRFPRPVDRTAVPLLLMVLLLLVWPRIDPVRVPMKPPSPTLPPPQRPNEPPAPQQREDERRQPPSSAQQPAGASAQGVEQSSAGDQRQQSPQSQSSEQGQSRQTRAGSDSTSSASGAQDGEHTAAHTSGQSGQSQDAAPAGQADRRQAEGRQGQGANQAASSQADAGRQDERSGRRGGQQASMSQRGGQQAGGDRAQAASPGSQARQGDGQGQQDAAGQSAAGSASGMGREGSAEGEALKAQIQELLHEMSGEIEQLQAQLSSLEKSQSPPTIGASTDPELFEAAEPLDGPAGASLPIQLQTDTTQIRSQRPGGGTGTPSDTVDNARPTAKAEDVQLAEEPLEERAASRQVVPLEYRTVFDRLRKRPSEHD